LPKIILWHYKITIEINLNQKSSITSFVRNDFFNKYKETDAEELLYESKVFNSKISSKIDVPLGYI